MYVLIDMDQCAITHKHRDRVVLNQLGWIECRCACHVIPLGNPRFFGEVLTPLEMQKIYQNATGVPLQAYGNIMTTVLHELARRMPDTECVPAEVEMQAAHVLPADPSNYKYVLGSKTPEELPGLFSREPIKVGFSQEEIAGAATTYAKFAAAQARNPPPAPKPAEPGGTATPAAPRAPRAATGAPRQGGVRDIVFKVADEMWEAAGSPREVSIVLKLRKDIMDRLESEHQLKRTTASTTLGDWQKQRL